MNWLYISVIIREPFNLQPVTLLYRYILCISPYSSSGIGIGKGKWYGNISTSEPILVELCAQAGPLRWVSGKQVCAG